MEPIMVIVLGLSILVCAYMAWNIGANDVANAMGTSVGSRALTLKQAVILAAIFEFCGAFFAGDAVTDTVRKGILSVDFTDTDLVTEAFANDLMYAFIAAMMCCGLAYNRHTIRPSCIHHTLDYRGYSRCWIDSRSSA